MMLKVCDHAVGALGRLLKGFPKAKIIGRGLATSSWRPMDPADMARLFNNKLEAPSELDLEIIADRQLESNVDGVIGMCGRCTSINVSGHIYSGVSARFRLCRRGGGALSARVSSRIRAAVADAVCSQQWVHEAQLSLSRCACPL